MSSINSAGRGSYNYYHVKRTYDDGKVRTPWYEKDLSKEEICSGNAGTPDRNYEGADLCRKIADTYRSTAESNRAKYKTAQEASDAIWAKYNSSGEYSAYSYEERGAMASNELNMTLYGKVKYHDVLADPHLNGEVSLNTHNGSDVNGSREFNMKTLSAQFSNLWRNNGIDTSLMNGKSFSFSVNGMSMLGAVTLLGGGDGNDTLLGLMTSALNSKSNSKNLFYNLLYDGNKQGTLPKDSLAKFKLYSEFKDITGLDIRNFEQTKNGFIDSEGRNAVSIYEDALKGSDKVQQRYKGTANEYFKSLVNNAMNYNIAETPDLELSMKYVNGNVYLNGTVPHLNIKI